MAFRVDDIVVSDKNVLLLQDGEQYIADIEQTYDYIGDSSHTDNLWNMYNDEGKFIHNIFNVKDFEICTQVKNGIKSSDERISHEQHFMPNASKYKGNCQLFDASYTLSDYTTSAFKSFYNTNDALNNVYEADNGFIRYESLSSYNNMVDYYITPNIVFHPILGVQYLTEYPISYYYSDFGDNESTDKPVVYGDSVNVKYYMNSKYSVDTRNINTTSYNASQLRTYYDIGNTGNSIYMVFRNNKNGVAKLSGDYQETHNYNNDDYVINCGINGIASMDNVTTISTEDTSYYAATPYSDFFTNTDIPVSAIAVQPKDLSFILYYVHDSANKCYDLTYIPSNGLVKNKYTTSIKYTSNNNIDIKMLDSSIIVATDKVVMNIWSDKSKHHNNKISAFNPFEYASFINYDEEIKVLDGKTDSTYKNFKLYYNNSNILACVMDDSTKRLVILSTRNNNVELGENFHIAVRNDYELSVEHQPQYSTNMVISSVPVKYIIDDKETITYALSSVQSDEITGYNDVYTFDYTINTLTYSNTHQKYADILFDYASVTNIDFNIGEYAFISFNDSDGKNSLLKINAKDIPTDNTEVFARCSYNGVSNKGIPENILCTDVHITTISYDPKNDDKLLSDINKIDDNKSFDYIKSQAGMMATYAKKSSASTTDIQYYQSFALSPLNNDSLTVEPVFTQSTASTANVDMQRLKTFKYILDKYIHNSAAVTIKNITTNNINHDSSIALVKWINSEDDDGYVTVPKDSLSGTHLQYSGITSEVYITRNADGNDIDKYRTVVYEYPHPSYGNLKTAGTGISIFDGELDGSMTTDDLIMVNDYFIVKNYHVVNNECNITTASDFKKDCGKVYKHDTGNFPSGGYVVTDFFKSETNNIYGLYSSELVYSSKVDTLTTNNSEKIYDYNFLWHVKPTNGIEFYPASNNTEPWRPFYVTKYVDFIKYHNGYYYIGLSDAKTKTSSTVSYDIIETESLFIEKDTIPLTTGTYVSDIRFFGDNIIVEYIDSSNNKTFMNFRSGEHVNKTHSVTYVNTSTLSDEDVHVINVANLELTNDNSLDVHTTFDNIEIVNSLNRFTSTVNHKSSLFSIKISDLGIDDSKYLTDTQKSNLKMWLKNKISDIVDNTKPAHTQLFDVYID